MKAKSPKQLHDFTDKMGRCSKCGKPRSEHVTEYVIDESGKGQQVAIEEKKR